MTKIEILTKSLKIPMRHFYTYIQSNASSTTPTAPDFNSTVCPEKDTMVSWKGRQSSRILFQSETSVILRVNIPNNTAEIDVINGEYIGFLGYPGKYCGYDFLNAFMDDRVSWDLYDYEPHYKRQYKYRRPNGKHASVMLQYLRHRFLVNLPAILGQK